MNKKLVEWQKRLGLTDWRIVLEDKCVPDAMELSDSAGCASWEETTRTARIQILDPAYYGQRVVPFDWEKTLVHELLHLKFCMLSDNGTDLQSRLVHQMIDDIARALVDARREKNDTSASD